MHPTRPDLAPPTAPTFLEGLFDSLDLSDPDGFIADCPICTCEGMTVRPNWVERIWVFTCADGCAHEEVTRWLKADVRLWPELEEDWSTQAWIALMLAPTVEICETLMRGEHVAEHRLDQKWLARFREAGVI
jgi:hypothetical protein